VFVVRVLFCGVVFCLFVDFGCSICVACVMFECGGFILFMCFLFDLVLVCVMFWCWFC